MTSFFYQTAQSLINQYPDRFPLLKITHLLDWQAIEAKLQNKKNRSVTDNNGRPAYALLPMFRAILLGQWHSLSDPELERSLVTRLDFVLFCQFPDETQLPDHSTLNRFRNWLMKDQLLDELIDEINQQLARNQLKVEKAQTAIVDASIIQTAGSKAQKTIEITADNQVNTTPASKDTDAQWTIKGKRWHLGYKLHMRTDAEGFIEAAHVTAANAADVHNLEPLLSKVPTGTKVYADKGYDSGYNRQLLAQKQLADGIMQRARKNQPLSRNQIERNKQLSKIRYRVEQSFAILHRIFKCKRASYFGLTKVKGQMLLKAICLNLLKAANKLRTDAPIVGELRPMQPEMQPERG